MKKMGIAVTKTPQDIKKIKNLNEENKDDDDTSPKTTVSCCAFWNKNKNKSDSKKKKMVHEKGNSLKRYI